MTDYRLKLLEFLEPLPNYKGNILPLVEEYLSEIHRHERTLFLDILKPLANNGYVKFPQETINGLTMLTALKYIHDDIIVRMTYESHDYLEELRKKKNPSPQPVIDMSQEEETEHAMLNFFKVHGGFATVANMLHDLHSNGISVDGWAFDRVVKNNWFEHKFQSGDNFYKLNDGGIARLNRLTQKWEKEKTKDQSSNIAFHGDIHGSVNTGTIGRDQVGGSVEQSKPYIPLWKKIALWWTENLFMRILVVIIGGIVLYFILKDWFHKP